MNLKDESNPTSSQKKNIPKLRFPEFVNAGEWEERKLGEVFIGKKGKG